MLGRRVLRPRRTRVGRGIPPPPPAIPGATLREQPSQCRSNYLGLVDEPWRASVALQDIGVMHRLIKLERHQGNGPGPPPTTLSGSSQS